MQAYSLDLRQRIVAALDAGKRPSEVAAQFSVGVSTVKRYRQQRRDTGRLDPRFSPGRTPTIRPDQRDALWAQLVEHPTAIRAEHCALWAAETGVPGIDPRTVPLDLSGVKASFGLTSDVDTLTYQDLQKRREVIRKRMEERRKTR